MKKIITNLCMTIIIIFAFCNLLGVTVSVETITKSYNPIVVQNTNEKDNVLVTNENYDQVKPSKKSAEIIGRSCNSEHTARGFTNSNGVFEYTATNKIECSCRVRASNGTVHDYSKTISGESNTIDCNGICDEICQDFANKIQ